MVIKYLHRIFTSHIYLFLISYRFKRLASQKESWIPEVISDDSD